MDYNDSMSEGDDDVKDNGRAGIESIVPWSERDYEWWERRRQLYVETVKQHVAHCNVVSAELDRCLENGCLGGLKPLRLLIADYAVAPREVWLAERRMMAVLQLPIRTSAHAGGSSYNKHAKTARINSIAELIATVPEDERINIEKQISSWDPFEDGDPMCSNIGELVYKNKADIRFYPELDVCNGCGQIHWTAIRSVKGNEVRQLRRRNGKRRMGPDPNYTKHFVCHDCATFCMCTPSKLHMYKQQCTICHKTKCHKHDFTTFIQKNPSAGGYPQRLTNPQYQCNDCLQTLDHGRTFDSILTHPNPHTAFADYYALKMKKIVNS
jgi:hypothetical protein